jgi:hypothetical protein
VQSSRSVIGAYLSPLVRDYHCQGLAAVRGTSSLVNGFAAVVIIHNCQYIKLMGPTHFQLAKLLSAQHLEKSILYAIIRNKNNISSGRPPLWSSGQSFWLQIQRSRVRFQALPDFLRSSGSGTGSTQPREDN